MAQRRFNRQMTSYEFDNLNREEEHMKLITYRTDELGLSSKYVDSLVKIEKLYIKVIKRILFITFVVFPAILLLFSVYQSFVTCNGLFGDSVNLFFKWHRNYKKFNIDYDQFYNPNQDVDFHKYPWMVRIIYLLNNKSHFGCSGFLITDRDIATAAHCFEFESGFKIDIEIHLSGTAENGFRDSIVITNDQLKILLHPKFKYYKQQHDIALIKLNKPVKFTTTVFPIRLPFDKIWIPDNLTLTGWIDNNNTIHNPVLKEEVIPIFSVDFCNKNTNREFKHQIVIASFQKTTVPNQFCGGLHNTYIARGDSGMPIQLMDDSEPMAFGIISSGPKVGVKKPQIFTTIYPYLHWILCNAGDEFCSVPKK